MYRWVTHEKKLSINKLILLLSQVSTETLVSEIKYKTRGTQTEWSALGCARALSSDEDPFLNCQAEELGLDDVRALLARYKRLCTGEKEGPNTRERDKEKGKEKECTERKLDNPHTSHHRFGDNDGATTEPKPLHKLMEEEILRLSVHGPSPTREQILQLFNSFNESPDHKKAEGDDAGKFK